jgi:hypothetical protein
VVEELGENGIKSLLEKELKKVNMVDVLPIPE